jgi:nucleoside-diphosphate-sugar epimerase
MEALNGRHLLVTGVTGFLGKVWLAMVLDHFPQIARVSVIVRPRSRRDSALDRFEKIIDTSPVFRPLRAKHGAALGQLIGPRLEVLSGDVEKRWCGLETETVERLARTVDLVVHCAGITDFQPDPLRALGVNVVGASHAADLAVRCGAKMLHVSTCFVAGNVSGEVTETLTPGLAPSGHRFSVSAEIRALQMACRTPEASKSVKARIELGKERALALGYPNIYTYTKGLAEHALASRPDLDLVVVRPSIVECARTYPMAGWNEGANTAGPLAWLITSSFRRLPTHGQHAFDIIPVDDVARGMTLVAAAALEGRAKTVYHLASSHHNPLYLGRTVELTGLAMRRWTRKGGGDAWQRLVLKQLDPVPVANDEQGMFSAEKMGGWTRRLRDRLTRFDRSEHLPPAIDELVGDALERVVADLKDRVGAQHHLYRRIEHMLELYRPFIYDNDYLFRTDHIEELAQGVDGDWAYEVSSIDWRHYWVDVEYPGLRTWCMPILEGDKVPLDPPSIPPFRLARDFVDRAASK